MPEMPRTGYRSKRDYSSWQVRYVCPLNDKASSVSHHHDAVIRKYFMTTKGKWLLLSTSWRTSHGPKFTRLEDLGQHRQVNYNQCRGWDQSDALDLYSSNVTGCCWSQPCCDIILPYSRPMEQRETNIIAHTTMRQTISGWQVSPVGKIESVRVSEASLHPVPSRCLGQNFISDRIPLISDRQCCLDCSTMTSRACINIALVQ